MRTLILFVMSLAAAGTGCSWIGVSRPTPSQLAHVQQCTRQYALPIIDTVFATGALTGMTAVIVYDARHETNPDSQGFDVIADAALAAIAVTFAASAVHGYRVVHACSIAK